MMTKRSEILKMADGLISRDRHETHGDALSTHKRIAEFWSTYLQTPIAPHQVATMMELMKIARRTYDPKNPENYLDAIGYAAIGYEVADEE